MVVTDHALSETFPWILNAGVVGVTAFFTLSGFLITTLLLQEQSRTGRISLPRFWARRVRRFAPALLAAAAVATIFQWGTPISNSPALVIGALTWSTNWLMIDGSWPPVPLGHTWTLAVEEQFYDTGGLMAEVAAEDGRGVAGVGGVEAGHDRGGRG